MKKSAFTKKDLLIVLLIIFGFIAINNLSGERAGEKSSILDKMTSEKMDSEKMDSEVLPVGDFQVEEGGKFFGEIYVKGYTETVELDEPFCEEDCKKFDAVLLNATIIGNQAFEELLSESRPPNTPPEARPRFIIGCLEGDTMRYANHSDEFGMKEDFELSTEQTSMLLASSPDSPVTIRLKKLELNGGMGAPACYSHFTEIEVL